MKKITIINHSFQGDFLSTPRYGVTLPLPVGVLKLTGVGVFVGVFVKRMPFLGQFFKGVLCPFMFRLLRVIFLEADFE